MIVGRFTDGANVSIEGQMGVKSDAKNFDAVMMMMNFNVSFRHK